MKELLFGIKYLNKISPKILICSILIKAFGSFFNAFYGVYFLRIILYNLEAGASFWASFSVAVILIVIETAYWYAQRCLFNIFNDKMTNKVNEQVLTTAPEAWSGNVVVEPERYNATIHYLNNNGWGEVGFYAWGNAGNLGAWPGALVQDNADHEGWYDGVVTNFGESTIKVIFNENGKGGQTDDLVVDLTAGVEFWVVDGNVLTTAPENWD